MAILSPVTSRSVEVAVGAAATSFSATMSPGEWWLFVSSTACWIAQGANPTAAAADGSMYVPAGVPVVLDPLCGAKLSVIQDSAGGKASLTPHKVY